MARPALAKGDDGSGIRYDHRWDAWKDGRIVAHLLERNVAESLLVARKVDSIGPAHQNGAQNCPRCVPERTFCTDCGLYHRHTCPTTAAIKAILSVPTPEPVDYTLPACEWGDDG